MQRDQMAAERLALDQSSQQEANGLSATSQKQWYTLLKEFEKDPFSKSHLVFPKTLSPEQARFFQDQATILGLLSEFCDDDGDALCDADPQKCPPAGAYLHVWKPHTLKSKQAASMYHTAPVELNESNDASYVSEDARFSELVFGDLITIVNDRPTAAASTAGKDNGAEGCYLSTLQNPLRETARLVLLPPGAISHAW